MKVDENSDQFKARAHVAITVLLNKIWEIEGLLNDAAKEMLETGYWGHVRHSIVTLEFIETLQQIEADLIKERKDLEG